MEGHDEETVPAAPQGRLQEAIRQARIDQAEHSDVLIDLRALELTRLEVLKEALQPVFDEIPEGVDQFDFALVPGESPRLWVDMVAFVTMSRDRKLYRFLRDTRSGRQVLAESADAAVIARRVTDYVAHRLVERERALAGGPEQKVEPPPQARQQTPPQVVVRSSFGERALAFLIGVAFGALGLLAYAYYTAPWMAGPG